MEQVEVRMTAYLLGMEIDLTKTVILVGGYKIKFRVTREGKGILYKRDMNLDFLYERGKVLLVPGNSFKD